MRRRRVGHNFGVSGDAFVAEGWLDELALRLPGRCVVRQESLAEYKLKSRIIPGLVETRGSANQYGFDVVRVGELANGNMKKAVKGHIAEVSCTALAKAGPVVRQFRQAAQEEITLWTGKASDRSSRGHCEMVCQNCSN